jgi:metal-responsive CopG/Arc/MetJ family transcriptional regulator
MDHQLTNFNIPITLRMRLDEIAKSKGLSRTAILNQLIETYCRQERQLMDQDEKFDVQRRQHDRTQDERSSSYYDPPMIPSPYDDYAKSWSL